MLLTEVKINLKVDLLMLSDSCVTVENTMKFWAYFPKSVITREWFRLLKAQCFFLMVS